VAQVRDDGPDVVAAVPVDDATAGRAAHPQVALQLRDGRRRQRERNDRDEHEFLHDWSTPVARPWFRVEAPGGAVLFAWRPLPGPARSSAWHQRCPESEQSGPRPNTAGRFETWPVPGTGHVSYVAADAGFAGVGSNAGKKPREVEAA
jgi:hypothetical protein